MEIERKFMVANDSWKNTIKSSVEIDQYYLTSADAVNEVRVRRTKNESGISWVLTVKRFITEVSRVEVEKDLTESEGEELAQVAVAHLSKIRYFMTDSNFTVDLYPSGLCTAEIELTNEDEQFSLPSFLGREMTGDTSVANRTLAKGINS